MTDMRETKLLRSEFTSPRMCRNSLMLNEVVTEQPLYLKCYNYCFGTVAPMRATKTRHSSSFMDVASFTSRPLYARGNNPRYPSYRTLGKPQVRKWQVGEQKFLWEIAGYRRYCTEFFRLLGYYAVWGGSYRDYITVHLDPWRWDR